MFWMEIAQEEESWLSLEDNFVDFLQAAARDN